MQSLHNMQVHNVRENNQGNVQGNTQAKGWESRGFQDPRPDLGGDSILWVMLLKLAYEMDYELYGRMHFMRCMGTRLQPNPRWGYVMQPLIDKRLGWSSRAEYDRDTRRWLDPYRKQVVELLGRVFDPFEQAGAG